MEKVEKLIELVNLKKMKIANNIRISILSIEYIGI